MPNVSGQIMKLFLSYEMQVYVIFIFLLRRFVSLDTNKLFCTY